MIDRAPVRYSVGQWNFDPDLGKRIVVRLAGEIVQQVVEYDCEAGTVLCNRLDADGNVKLNEARDGIARDLKRGNVTVELSEA